jgi:hypothetical protein
MLNRLYLNVAIRNDPKQNEPSAVDPYPAVTV